MCVCVCVCVCASEGEDRQRIDSGWIMRFTLGPLRWCSPRDTVTSTSPQTPPSLPLSSSFSPFFSLYLCLRVFLSLVFIFSLCLFPWHKVKRGGKGHKAKVSNQEHNVWKFSAWAFRERKISIRKFIVIHLKTINGCMRCLKNTIKHVDDISSM